MMKKKFLCEKISYITLFVTAFLTQSVMTHGKPVKQDFYQLKIYYLKDDSQLLRVDEYLKNAYLPALHRAGIKNIGVFKPIGNDTAKIKSVYVLIPFSSADAWMRLSDKLFKDAIYNTAAKNFIQADASSPPYLRIESVIMEAFSGQPNLLLPASKNAERVFELRSYESPTQHLHEKKVAMFNTGGEIQIFNRLGFNPVFYGKVLSGSHMPNFMYMPIFESVEKRDAQWKAFGNDAQWKDISTRPENENKVAVSHIDSILMHSTEYSDF
jgi:hypothetical protein